MKMEVLENVEEPTLFKLLFISKNNKLKLKKSSDTN